MHVKHVTDKVNNIAKLTEMDEKETNQPTGEIKMLKAAIEKLKEENIEKINELTKLHLLERNGLQKENIILKHTIDVINVNKYNELKDNHKIEVMNLYPILAI